MINNLVEFQILFLLIFILLMIN